MKAISILLALAVAATLFHGASAAQAQHNRRTAVYDVANDRGGSIVEYARRVAALKRQDRLVRFRGNCASACTLFLSLPRNNVCIEPGTTFLFHAAHSSSATLNQWGSDYLMSNYPAWVRTWIRSRGGLTNRVIRMNYAYAARHVPTCGRA